MGALFKNTNKKSEKSPDYTGDVEIDGAKYKLAGWVKTAKTGTKYISLSAKLDDTIKDEVQSFYASDYEESEPTPF